MDALKKTSTAKQQLNDAIRMRCPSTWAAYANPRTCAELNIEYPENQSSAAPVLSQNSTGEREMIALVKMKNDSDIQVNLLTILT